MSAKKGPPEVWQSFFELNKRQCTNPKESFDIGDDFGMLATAAHKYGFGSKIGAPLGEYARSRTYAPLSFQNIFSRGCTADSQFEQHLEHNHPNNAPSFLSDGPDSYGHLDPHSTERGWIIADLADPTGPYWQNQTSFMAADETGGHTTLKGAFTSQIVLGRSPFPSHFRTTSRASVGFTGLLLSEDVEFRMSAHHLLTILTPASLCPVHASREIWRFVVGPAGLEEWTGGNDPVLHGASSELEANVVTPADQTVVTVREAAEYRLSVTKGFCLVWGPVVIDWFVMNFGMYGFFEPLCWNASACSALAEWSRGDQFRVVNPI